MANTTCVQYPHHMDPGHTWAVSGQRVLSPTPPGVALKHKEYKAHVSFKIFFHCSLGNMPATVNVFNFNMKVRPSPLPNCQDSPPLSTSKHTFSYLLHIFVYNNTKILNSMPKSFKNLKPSFGVSDSRAGRANVALHAANLGAIPNSLKRSPKYHKE